MNTFFAQSAYLLPVIKRARAFHLYTQTKRYLDLYLCRGAAVLGHQYPGYSSVMKNVIEQAMYMPYPNIWHQRLLHALQKTFAPHHVGVFMSLPVADEQWQEAWQPPGAEYALWRPSLPMPDARFISPVLPVSAQPCRIIITKYDSFPENWLHLPIPAIWARVLLKAVQLWSLAQALPAMSSRWKQLFESKGRVHGRYFFSLLGEKEHAAWYQYALHRGVVLPPLPQLAGVMPLEMSRGEKKLLQEVLQWA